MSEENLRKCTKCDTLKIRILVGKFNNERNKKYHNEKGKIWRGSVCPECHKEDMKNRMKASRALKKVIEE